MKKWFKKWIIIIIIAGVLIVGEEFPLDVILVAGIIVIWELMDRLDKVYRR